MVEKAVFRKVIDQKDGLGGIKKQVSLVVSSYDTSQMEGYKAGSKVYTGYTCQIKVSKFGNKPSVSYVNIDPQDKDIEEALKLMYAEVHKLPQKK